MSLKGKSVLVTRAASQAAEFVSAIERSGGKAILFPTISIEEPESWDTCDEYLGRLYMYEGLLFTSANAADFFFGRMKTLNIPSELQQKVIIAVGERTAGTIKKFGLDVTLTPEKFTSFDLARLLTQEDVRGKTFLFPRGNLSKDTLKAAIEGLGGAVDTVVVYRTTPPLDADIGKVREMIANREVDFITFTSPSTVHNFFSFIPLTSQLLEGCEIAVIGPVTESALRNMNIEPSIVAPAATAESLVQAMAAYDE